MADLKSLIDAAQVRAAIRTDLKESDLPTTVIELPVNTQSAVAEVLRRDPQAAERDGDAKQHVANALNLLIAATILPSMPFLTKEDFGDGGGLTRQSVNIPERVSELKAKATEELSFVRTDGQGSPGTRIPKMFGLAHGTRGV